MGGACGQRVRAWLGLTILFGVALLRVPATGAAVSEEFPFQLNEGFIWVKIQATESAAPLNFLLDSGASVSVINLQTADKVGLKPGRRVSVQGVGASTEGFWPQHLSATAGGVRLPGDYLAVDLSDLSGSCGCGVDGLIGLDFFRGRVVQLDFAAGKIRVLAAAPAAVGQETLPLKVRPGGLARVGEGGWGRGAMGATRYRVLPAEVSGRKMYPSCSG